MTQRSILEYAEAVRGRYLRVAKKAKTKILDEFVAATGLHRKAAMRLLNRSAALTCSRADLHVYENVWGVRMAHCSWTRKLSRIEL